MKIRMTLKDPDGVGDALEEAIDLSFPPDMDEEEKELLRNHRREKIKSKIDPWVRYLEYVTIEFDLEKGTATVLDQYLGN